jgi:hypothetical protein
MDTTGTPEPYFSVPPECRFHLGFSLVGVVGIDEKYDIGSCEM